MKPTALRPAGQGRSVSSATTDAGAAAATLPVAATGSSLSASSSPPAESAPPRRARSADLAPTTSPSAEPPLLSYEGYLIVRSTVDATVHVQGVALGPTNTRLRTRSCHTRNLRLKDRVAGTWLTAGQPVKIHCMETTTVNIDP